MVTYQASRCFLSAPQYTLLHTKHNPPSIQVYATPYTTSHFIMARTRTTTGPTTSTSRKPGLLSRLAGKKTHQNARVTESTSTNPITGNTTTTRKTTTHPGGIGHHGHAGKGPLASKSTGVRGTGAHGPATTGRNKGMTTARKPTMGDKISGAMTKVKGSLTGKPGVKVSRHPRRCFERSLIESTQGAGTRRMHGTDGRGSHRVY